MAGFDLPSRCSFTIEQFDRDGACRLAGSICEDRISALEDRLPAIAGAGSRLTGLSWLADWLRESLVPSAEEVGGRRHWRPVRAILFDKTAGMNWSLGWHQDRTIVVKDRKMVPGFGPWSVKSGLHHVEPPFAILADMLTVRIHIDRVDATNAPLRIAVGSHKRGKIAEPQVAAIVAESRIVECHAERGDMWFYATPILHASAPTDSPRRRRVLQVDFACAPLPGELEWRGIE